MRLSDYSSAKRRETVILALSFVLQDLKAPASTYEVSEAIAARLEDPSARQLIGRVLMSIAPSIPQAQASSATFRKFGREMRRWVWSPKSAVAVAAVDPASLAIRQPLAPVRDQWAEIAEAEGATVEETKARYAALQAAAEAAPAEDW